MTAGSDRTGIDLVSQRVLDAALQARRQARNRAPEIPVIPRAGKIPLSMAQKSIWFTHLVSQDTASFNVVLSERLHGRLDADCLKTAFDDLVLRHEVLRLKIVADQAEPFCTPCDSLPQLEVYEKGGVAEADRGEMAQELLDAFAKQPIDISAQPPVRARLYRFSRDDALLIIVLHHIACDEWSVATLRSDFAALYRRGQDSAAPELPKLTLQYADVAAHETLSENSGAYSAVLDRWAERLKGARTDDTLPMADTDEPREGVDNEVALQLSRSMALKLDAFGREHGATPFITMLAASLFLLHTWTGRSDITIATQVAGRTSQKTARIAGPFTNTVAIRSKVENGADFVGILTSVREQVRDVLAHQNVRFEALLRRLRVKRSYDTPPFGRITFTHRDSFGGLELAENVTSSPMKSRGKRAKRDLWINATDRKDDRLLRIVYNGARYSRARLEHLLRDFEILIGKLIAGESPAITGIGPSGHEEISALTPQCEPERKQVQEHGDPTTATLEKVAAIWSETLRADKPLHDVSFFDEGGDSLLLLRLVHRIEEEFGRSFPLGDAFLSPTIQHIAACLDRKPPFILPKGHRDRLLEPLLHDQTGRQTPRFFFVSGGGGHVAPFSRIARLMESRWEAIGVKDPALFEEEPAVTSIETLATRMVHAVRSADPHGPWVLAGYSAGGRTVYEIARQMRDAGGAAGCVIIDAGVSSPGLASSTLRLMRKIKRAGRVACRRIDDQIARLLAAKDDPVDIQRRHFRRVSDTQHGRLLTYVPETSQTPVALVRAVSSGRRERRHDYGWSGVTDLISTFDTPGNHFNCFRKPHETSFATALQQALDAVHGRLASERSGCGTRTDDD